MANVQGIASIPAIRLERKLGTLPDETMIEIRRALSFALDLRNPAKELIDKHASVAATSTERGVRQVTARLLPVARRLAGSNPAAALPRHADDTAK